MFGLPGTLATARFGGFAVLPLLAVYLWAGGGSAPWALPPECARIVDLNAVYYGTQAWGLNREARVRLDENLEVLEHCPELCVEVVGFADGREPSPDRISFRRAEAVREYYLGRGVGEGRLRARGGSVAPDDAYGEDRGVGSRRVESIPGTCR